MVGVDAEMIFDSREQSSSSGSYGVDLNCDIILVTFLTVPIPVPIPSYSSEETRFRSAVLTRVIQRYGILEKTIAYADNAAISTENVVYDAQTGEVLLTKTKNEYKDDIYNVSYPAHWVGLYDGMKQAYHNSDIVLNVNFAASPTPNTGGYVTLGNNGNIPSGEDRTTYLKQGDEIVYNNTRYWLTDDGYFMDRNGNVINRNGSTVLNMDIKVNRTVRRNMQTIPVANITTRINPITALSGGVNTLSSNYVTDAKQVLSASATSYSTNWKNYCITSSEVFANRGGFNARGLVDALNYLFKSGHVGTSVTEVTVPITSNSCCSTEYALYQQSFVKRIFDNCAIAEEFTYNYTASVTVAGDPFKKWYMSFPTCSKFAGSWAGQFPFGVHLPINACNTSSVSPVRIEYLSDNITYPTPYTLGNSVMIRAYFPGGCYVDGYVQIEGDTYRYGATGYECVSKAPEVNNRFAINEGMIWRKQKDLVFLANRSQDDGGAAPLDIRKHGIYGAFGLNMNQLLGEGVLGDWKYTSETTKYIPEGFEVETRDALNRYNSVLYETDQLPVAVANNAERREIGTDGFEYYPTTPASSTGCYERHWHFKKNPAAAFTIDKAVSHTGISSLKLAGGGQVSNSYFTRGCGNTATGYGSIMSSICDACLLPFNPYPKKEYVISGWVKTAAASNQGNVNDRNVTVLVTYNQQTDPVVISINPSGTIIEGWQRFEKKITIPEDGFTIDVTLKASSTLTTWFDDIRIYPFNGNMKTFVYDPATHRLMAELDENNYATFYEYDEQGALKRVKKETERGILTIKESRNHTSK